MGLDEPAVYEEWDLTPPTVPRRSRLFSLEPVGIGTPETESLTGYVARLAEAHGVEARQLVVREILPLVGRQHLAEPRRAGLLSAFWRNETRALNGTRSLARNLVRALESLTGRQELRFLTLLSWTDVLPVRGLQRRARVWCPACYEEWRGAGQPVYEPLVWTLVPITACPRHRRRLRQVCSHPNCHRSSSWLAPQSRPGYCSRCGCWLGLSPDEEPVGGEALPEEELQVQAWMVHAVGELIAAAPRLAVFPRRQRIVEVVCSSVESLAGGNRRAWAREMGLRMETVARWQWGEARPTLWLLLQVCSRLGTTPLGLLMGDAAATEGTRERRPPPKFPCRPTERRSVLDLKALRRALGEVLASDEQPPPSLREAARRLGCTYASLHRHLPETCGAIADRYRSYQMDRGLQGRQQLCSEVRQATRRVHEQGLYPSAYRVGLLLSEPVSIRSRPARAAWRETLRELGWRG